MLAHTSADTSHAATERHVQRRTGSPHPSARRPGRRPRAAHGRRARGDQEAQDRPRADRAAGTARVRAGHHDERDQSGAAARDERTSRRRRRCRSARSCATPAARTRAPATAVCATRRTPRATPRRCWAARNADRRRVDGRHRRDPADGPRLQRPRPRAQAALGRSRSGVRGRRGDHDHRPRSQAGGVRVARERQAPRDRRDRQRLGYDRAQHGDDARVPGDRRTGVARVAHRSAARSGRRHVQHDLRRRRHVDQRRGVLLREARRRRSDAGTARGADRGMPRSRGRDGERRRRRDQDAHVHGQRRARRAAGTHDRARGDQLELGEDRAVRRRPELGPHGRRRRLGRTRG